MYIDYQLVRSYTIEFKDIEIHTFTDKIPAKEIAEKNGEKLSSLGNPPKDSEPTWVVTAVNGTVENGSKVILKSTTYIPNEKTFNQTQILQAELNTILGLELTGTYGQSTIEAVKELQEKLGIKQTGVFDYNTLYQLEMYQSTHPEVYEAIDKVVTSNNYYLTKEQLISIGYSEDILTDTFMDGLNYTIDKYIIDGSTDQAKNKERIAKFIAQISVESGFGKYTVEQGNVDYFNKVYGIAGTKESKMGDIVNEETGLRRYSGAGYLQLSTRSNYEAFAKDMNDPEILNQGVYYVAENYSWQSAGWWWKSNGMNSFIDKGATIEQVSKRVNGGKNGLSERISVYNKIMEYLNY